MKDYKLIKISTLINVVYLFMEKNDIIMSAIKDYEKFVIFVII